MFEEKKIKLIAKTNNDLKILSYLCQDSIMSGEEFFLDRSKNLFIATLSRYCWEKEGSNKKKLKDVNFRVVTGLQIKTVQKITTNNFKTNMIFYNLLAITSNKKNIILSFSMGSEIILDCNEINVIIEDLDIPWPTKLKPKHK